jgi:predicted Zn-dependent protease
LARYGLNLSLGLSITDEFVADLSCDRRGVLLGLVEIWQLRERYQEAVDVLLELRKQLPADIVIKLSLAELLLTTEPENKDHAEYVVKMTARLENECEIHAALLLYKARALRLLGLHTAARDAMTAGLRRRKDRPGELLKALAYERALVYADLGQAARSRVELEKLYAEDPGYEDVAERVGVGVR